VLAVVGILVVACDSPSPDGIDEAVFEDTVVDDASVEDAVVDDGIAPPPPEVDGTTWELVGGGGPGGDVVLVDGHPVTITFEGGRVEDSTVSG
jgi:hypothetical protein